MHSSALSMPPSGTVHREKSDRSRFVRSRSQPPGEHVGSFVSMPNLPSNTPMRNFIENLLHLSPHRHASTTNTRTSRTKPGSSLGTNLPMERSSRLRFANPSSSLYTPSSTDIQVGGFSLVVKFSALPISSLRRLGWRENFVAQAN